MIKTDDKHLSLKALTHLYIYHDGDSMLELEKCRINYDFNPQHIIRNDLEYLVPQLWQIIQMNKKFNNIFE